MKFCNICGCEYDNNSIPHYCRNCGKNLSDQIEKTDVLLFFSVVFKIIGFIGMFLFTFPLASCAITPLCLDGECFGDNYSIVGWTMIFLPVLFLIIGFIIKRKFKKECLLNLNKD